MKVSKEQAAENRERILSAAAALFRERGFDGIGVVDLMKSAGLTHGGFYGHFSSKEELMALASVRAAEDTLARWAQMVDDVMRVDGDPLATLTKAYLSRRHRDHPGGGCLMPALGADAARQPPSVRHAFTEVLHTIIATLIRVVPGKTKAIKREKALSTFASLVGALVLARAVDDSALSDEILRAVSASINS